MTTMFGTPTVVALATTRAVCCPSGVADSGY
jgi:hypothetical protein